MTATQFLTRTGRRIDKFDDFCYKIERNATGGDGVPVTIYANERIMSAMVADRTLNQAVNVATLPRIKKHIVVLPDGHEGYGFPREESSAPEEWATISTAVSGLFGQT